ncbi:MAG: carbon-nitrogen hydrolase family protein, partial [Nocardioides sp.]
MSTPPLRVAAGQAASAPGDLAVNVATACSLVTTAADLGARVLVLPELFLTGYAPSAWNHAAALDLDDARLGPLGRVAAERSVVVVASAAVRRRPDVTTLSVVLVDPRGAVTAPYDKQHLCGADETSFFTAGEHGATVVVDGWELGLGICYDGCFPEHAASAAAGGASAYLCPVAYFAGSEHRRDLYYAARAIDNGIYVVVAGLTGQCGAGAFSGGSAIYDPEGRARERDLRPRGSCARAG